MADKLMDNYVTRSEFDGQITSVKDLIAKESDERSADTDRIMRGLENLRTEHSKKASNLYSTIDHARRPPLQMLGLAFAIFSGFLGALFGVYTFMDAKIEAANTSHRDKFEAWVTSSYAELTSRGLRLEDKVDEKLSRIIDGP